MREAGFFEIAILLRVEHRRAPVVLNNIRLYIFSKLLTGVVFIILPEVYNYERRTFLCLIGLS